MKVTLDMSKEEARSLAHILKGYAFETEKLMEDEEAGSLRGAVMQTHIFILRKAELQLNAAFAAKRGNNAVNRYLAKRFPNLRKEGVL